MTAPLTGPSLDRLRSLCGTPRDGALLRFALGSALLDAGAYEEAATELAHATGFDPAYAAAWKMLGRALLSAGKPEQARAAWADGIAAAARSGDIQAQKEMQVFLRRLEKNSGP